MGSPKMAALLAVCGGLLVTSVANGQLGGLINKAKAKVAGTNNPSAAAASTDGQTETVSTAGQTGQPMPGLEDKIMPGESKVQIAQQDLDNMKNPSKASPDWIAVPHAPAADLLVGADGYQHRPTEGQREAGHLYSIQEQRTFMANCLADEKGCGTNYGKEETRLASMCGKKFDVTVSDSLIIKDIHYSRNIMSNVEDMNAVLWGLCQTNKDQLLANVSGFKLGTIPTKIDGGPNQVGQQWLYDKSTKTITVNYPPGVPYNDDRTMHMWILRVAK